MRAFTLARVGISVVMLCTLAIHCADPSIPGIQLITPAQNSVIVQGSVPFGQNVEVKVPVPGCGATTYPVDPETFAATLIRLIDGQVVSEADVTEAFSYTQDPGTGAYTYSGVVELVDFGDYQIRFTIRNDLHEGGATLNFRLEQSVAAFPGGAFRMTLSSLKQNPANCLLADFLLGIIYGIIQNSWFDLYLPSGAEILASGNLYPLPIYLPAPLGRVDVVLSLDEVNNDITMDGPDSYTIDLKGFVPPPFTGFDCLITAKADGVFNDMDPNDLDGSLTIEILDVAPSPGGSGCTLNPPSGPCKLIAGLDANPY